MFGLCDCYLRSSTICSISVPGVERVTRSPAPSLSPSLGQGGAVTARWRGRGRAAASWCTACTRGQGAAVTSTSTLSADTECYITFCKVAKGMELK